MFIVFDLDDTLADTDHRQHILTQEFPEESDKWNAFFDACTEDAPMQGVIYLLKALAFQDERHRVEIWTGRSDRVREQTEAWLRWHARINPWTKQPGSEQTEAWLRRHVKMFPNVELRMRKEGDYRHDIEIKQEWIEEFGKPDIVFDDRNKIVEWWRDMGITCCQVKNSDF